MGTKKQYLKRRIRRWITRHYKGLSDLISAILFLIGAVLVSLGTIYALCAEYYSVTLLCLGFGLIYVACDMFEYGRE